jgi:hypothetical protein
MAMRWKREIFLGGFLCAAIGFASAGNSHSLMTNGSVEGNQQDQSLKESWDYKTWTRVNARPLKLEAGIAAMCAPPSQLRNDSPHRDKFIVVYVNEIGRNAMLSEKTPQFPKGSAIIKEKLSSQNSPSPELLTAMRKREKGFNPAGNDWEFFVLSGDAKQIQAQGKLENCLVCHSAKRSNDFVFRNYLPSDVLMKWK